jgi:hypothetical protein
MWTLSPSLLFPTVHDSFIFPLYLRGHREQIVRSVSSIHGKVARMWKCHHRFIVPLYFPSNYDENVDTVPARNFLISLCRRPGNNISEAISRKISFFSATRTVELPTSRLEKLVSLPVSRNAICRLLNFPQHESDHSSTLQDEQAENRGYARSGGVYYY